MEKHPRLFLVDGSALAYRSYFAFIRNPLINSRGENTSAVFGFANSLFKILNEQKPDYLAVVFDTKAPTFRHKIYPEYKSTRLKMPEDMVTQLPKIRELVEKMNLPLVELDGYEADDLVGTIAVEAAKKKVQTVIVAGDKDFMQLVGDGIVMMGPQKGGGGNRVSGCQGSGAENGGAARANHRFVGFDGRRL